MGALRTETVELPTAFFRDLGEAGSVADVLDVVATWLPSIVDAERASVALAADHVSGLEVYAIGGNKAVPIGAIVPLDASLVGRVFLERRTINFHEFGPDDGADAAMLYAGGLRTCLDAPLLSHGICFGTLSVAHSSPGHFDSSAAATMEAVARLVAITIRVHRQVEHVALLAETDHLTGLPNRRTFDERFAAAWEAHAAAGTSFAMALIDLDGFKAINDRYGHDAGDEVLAAAAGVLSGGVRGDDIVARIGGEEFAVLLSGMPGAHIETWADRLRSRLSAHVVETSGDLVEFTASIGVTVVRADDLCAGDVYRRADRALYEAKEAGRDRVVLAAV